MLIQCILDYPNPRLSELVHTLSIGSGHTSSACVWKGVFRFITFLAFSKPFETLSLTLVAFAVLLKTTVAYKTTDKKVFLLLLNQKSNDRGYCKTKYLDWSYITCGSILWCLFVFSCVTLDTCYVRRARCLGLLLLIPSLSNGSQYSPLKHLSTPHLTHTSIPLLKHPSTPHLMHTSIPLLKHPSTPSPHAHQYPSPQAPQYPLTSYAQQYPSPQAPQYPLTSHTPVSLSSSTPVLLHLIHTSIPLLKHDAPQYPSPHTHQYLSSSTPVPLTSCTPVSLSSSTPVSLINDTITKC